MEFFSFEVHFRDVFEEPPCTKRLPTISRMKREGLLESEPLTTSTLEPQTKRITVNFIKFSRL